MGKATVTVNYGGGQYAVDVEIDLRRVLLKISRLTARISELNAKILNETDDARLAALKARRLVLQKRKEMLVEVPGSVSVTAWCADLSEELTGTVGTAEIARDRDEGLIILPGYDDDAEHDPERDGQCQSPLASTAFQSYLNLCLFPAAQKYAPRYRIGEITNISGDTCDIRLSPVTSRIRQIAVDQAISLAAVPISYMNCDGVAFDVGDRVLVRFRGGSWDSPQVIGFESNPQPCAVGPCYLLGTVTEIEGDYNDPLFRVYIQDETTGLVGIRCAPSDWVKWSVGDQVIAVNWHNCEVKDHCVDKDLIRHAGVIFDSINQLREDLGLRPLFYNRRLQAAAQRHLDDLTANCLLSHYGTDGSAPADRIFGANYNESADPYAGENVAFHADAESAFKGWVASPAHYANMIYPEFTEMGLAVGKYSTDCSVVVSPDLGREFSGLEVRNSYCFVHTFGGIDPPNWRVVPLARSDDDGV